VVNATHRAPRAVLLVANAASPYSRGLRVARSLAAVGWDVEIAAVDDGRHPVEQDDAGVRVRRYRPRGRWARWRTDAPRQRRRGTLGRLARWGDAGVKLIAWPAHVRAWWAALRAELPPADLYHAFGILTVPVALRLAADARRQGRAGRVVYDVIDVILESNNVAGVPGPVLAVWKWRERWWVRRSDLVVTVNDAIADHLASAWRLAERPTVLLNCQPRWTPPAERPDLIRQAAGIPPERRIVLFLGRLGRERGLDATADAVLRLHDAALVLLGFGAWEDRLKERDQDPRFAGRHYTLPPVHPDEVPAWTASADVSVIAVPANSLNQRLSSPNKFWESITAGTPVVVGRDLTVMRDIVEREGLGAVADPANADDLAAALRSVLEAPDEVRAAMRERCLSVTHDRYCWEVAVEPYLGALRRLDR
jgi:glycosyltransferase involved in cell wall biosynthesis